MIPTPERHYRREWLLISHLDGYFALGSEMLGLAQHTVHTISIFHVKASGHQDGRTSK